MTALSDFIVTLKDWSNRTDLSDNVVTSWIRMAEERLNSQLRYKDMVSREQAIFTDNCTPLPPDWLKLEYVKYVKIPDNTFLNIRRGRPFDFVSKDAYWERVRADGPYTAAPCYTIIGNDLFITGDVNEITGTSIEIGLYRKIPPLNEANWLYTSQFSLYLFASLAAGALYMIDDERVPTWEAKVTQMIDLLNEASRDSQNGASPMRKKTRSFG